MKEGKKTYQDGHIPISITHLLSILHQGERKLRLPDIPQIVPGPPKDPPTNAHINYWDDVGESWRRSSLHNRHIQYVKATSLFVTQAAGSKKGKCHLQCIFYIVSKSKNVGPFNKQKKGKIKWSPHRLRHRKYQGGKFIKTGKIK